jgi:hypothetical protein
MRMGYTKIGLLKLVTAATKLSVQLTKILPNYTGLMGNYQFFGRVK